MTPNRIAYGATARSWEALDQDISGRFDDFAMLHDKRVMFVAANQFEAAAMVAAGVSKELDFGLMDRSRLTDTMRTHLMSLGVSIAEIDGNELKFTGSQNAKLKPGRISVLTSGTTGLPKLIEHTIETLNTYRSVTNLEPNSWFVPYQIGSYAWYQMLALGMFVKGQNLRFGDNHDLMGSFATALEDDEITAVSSTPTFWRHAAMSIDQRTLIETSIRLISLGGEIVDQAILDRLRSMFPKAAIRHIYASSETGAAIVVSDGKAGFDASLLDGKSQACVGLRIENETLHVRSPYGNTTAQNAWIDTGDLVEMVDGRVMFRGRADNRIVNVGGHKAFPAEIEAQLLSHPDVVWARVSARKAPFVGYLPEADLVLRDGTETSHAESMLTKFCEERMADYAVPRFWTFLDAVPIRASLKS